MAGGNFSSDGDGPIAAINVTPLVDVMLVLLVIFMVTAPMMQQGVEVDLPKATTAPLKGSTEQIVVSIDKTGTIFLGAGNKVELPELADKVKVGKVNTDLNRQISTQYQINAIPTVMIFKGGTMVRKFVGFQKKEKLMSELDQLMQ